MNKKFLLMAMAVSLGNMAYAGDNFNTELTASFDTAFDEDGVDGSVRSLSANYYINSVDVSAGPLAEALFLERNSNAYIGYGYSNQNIDFYSPTLSRFSSSSQVNHLTVGGKYLFENSNIFVLGSLSHTRFKTESNAMSARTIDSGPIFNVGAGYYLSDDWTASFDTTFDEDARLSNLHVHSKKLFDLGGDKYFSIQGDVQLERDYDDSFSIGGDYYFNKRVSLGLSQSWSREQGDTRLDSTLVKANWFVTDNVSIGASADYKGGFNALAFSATARF